MISLIIMRHKFIKKIKSSVQTCKVNRGFTLIDIAIALLVIGLLSAPAAQSYNLWRKNRVQNITKGNLWVVKKSISEFYYKNDRYPCPADITLGPNDQDYGEENCDTAVTGGTYDVLTGGVPFNDLQISPDQTIDGWNSKLIYTVTEDLADPMTSFDEENANLQIYEFDRFDADGKECPGTWDLTDTNGHFAITSHGEDQAGSFSIEGTAKAECPSGSPDVNNINCSQEVPHHVLLDTCAKSSASTTNVMHYDDYVTYASSIPRRIWNLVPSDKNNIFSNDVFVGIGDFRGIDENDHAQKELDVMGNIKLKDVINPDDIDADENADGYAHAEMYCDKNGDHCMPPVKIGGADQQMDCTLNQTGGAVVRIAHNAVNCNILITQPGLTLMCPNGEYLQGIQNGEPICTTAE